MTDDKSKTGHRTDTLISQPELFTLHTFLEYALTGIHQKSNMSLGLHANHFYFFSYEIKKCQKLIIVIHIYLKGVSK